MKKIEFLVFVGEDSPLQKQICICDEDSLERNIEIVQKEAYNSEYTIEDDGQPEPEAKQTPEERIAQLEEALDMLLNGVTE